MLLNVLAAAAVALVTPHGGPLTPTATHLRASSFSMAGFGAPKPAPKTLEEMVRDMGNRLPKDPAETRCACGSGESYAACCRPFHVGDQQTTTPEAALRARWTAFAYRLPIFIIDSTDKTNSAFMKDRIKWAKRLSKTSMFDDFDFSASRLGVGAVEPGESEESVFMENSFTLQPKAPMGAAPVRWAYMCTHTGCIYIYV